MGSPYTVTTRKITAIMIAGAAATAAAINRALISAGTDKHTDTDRHGHAKKGPVTIGSYTLLL